MALNPNTLERMKVGVPTPDYSSWTTEIIWAIKCGGYTGTHALHNDVISVMSESRE